ncbi:MAG: M15 family metallopeptidase [Thermodesulfobacteriota bacterium]
MTRPGGMIRAALLAAVLLAAGPAYPEAGTWLDRLPARLLDQGSTRADLEALLLAYPGLVRSLEAEYDEIGLVLGEGRRLRYDDRRPKTFEEKLADPDLEDLFSQEYRPGPVTGPVPEDFDPGRFRPEAFFRAAYGDSAGEVRAALVPVVLAGRRVLFNRRHGAAEALGLVGGELESLAAKEPGLKKYLVPLGGTFNWRVIEGADRLSPHSFGLAVDLNPKHGAYWRWSPDRTPALVHKMRLEYPYQIVAVFERHGFIWGGKWFHFDLMHFEYRPELFLRAAAGGR